jgi:hypothetical protein
MSLNVSGSFIPITFCREVASQLSMLARQSVSCLRGAYATRNTPHRASHPAYRTPHITPCTPRIAPSIPHTAHHALTPDTAHRAQHITQRTVRLNNRRCTRRQGCCASKSPTAVSLPTNHSMYLHELVECTTLSKRGAGFSGGVVGRVHHTQQAWRWFQWGSSWSSAPHSASVALVSVGE